MKMVLLLFFQYFFINKKEPDPKHGSGQSRQVLHCKIAKQFNDARNPRLTHEQFNAFQANCIEPIDDGQCHIIEKSVDRWKLCFNLWGKVAHDQQCYF